MPNFAERLVLLGANFRNRRHPFCSEPLRPLPPFSGERPRPLGAFYARTCPKTWTLLWFGLVRTLPHFDAEPCRCQRDGRSSGLLAFCHICDESSFTDCEESSWRALLNFGTKCTFSQTAHWYRCIPFLRSSLAAFLMANLGEHWLPFSPEPVRTSPPF